MVNSLSRLGLPYNTTAENRRLAIELAGLVVAWERQRQSEMKVVQESENQNQIVDMLSPTVIGGDPKRSSDVPMFADDLSKRVKVEQGLQPLGVMSPGGASIPNIETPGSSGQPDEEYKPNAAMEEMIITFLIRVIIFLVLLFMLYK
jgi:transformation/transcription domain-associated protein